MGALRVCTAQVQRSSRSTLPKAHHARLRRFTDWGKGRRNDVEYVLRAYNDFLDRAHGLFDEIYSSNLDVIPGEQGRRPTETEMTSAIIPSDANFVKLKSEFDVTVLPVFHQDEMSTRLDKFVHMANGYICLSPNNHYAQNLREDWTLFHNLAAPGVHCHGLATTGIRMMRFAELYSGDSCS